MREKGMAAIACAALLWADVAAAQVADMQGCPATKLEAATLISKLKEKSRTSSGTISYATDGLRFLGDPVLGLFTDSDHGWLHIHLPRAPSAYAAAIKVRHAKGAQRVNCDNPDEGCYFRMKDDVAWGLHSLDFSTFAGRMAKEGEPDGRYLICFY